MDTIFGRDEITAILDKRIEGFKKGYRQNIVLIGNPLMGKTLLLRTVLSNIDRSHILPIFVEFEFSTLRQIVDTFCIQILCNFLKSQGIDTSQDLTYLTDKSQAFLPKTVAKIKTILQNLDKKKEISSLLDTFELTQIFFEESNRSCLLILDEFQNLENFGGEDIFVELGKKILMQKYTMYLIASSSKARAKEILSYGLSLLFGNFEVLEIGPFNISISDGFIMQKLNIEISDVHKKFLINFTSGHPFYLDRFCCELFAQARRYNLNCVTENVFIETFENLLFREWGILSQRFINFLNQVAPERQREDCIEILSSIICGYNKLKPMARLLNKKEKIIQQRMSRLYDAGIIVKNGDFLCVADKVFSFWLNFIYKKKREFSYFDEDVLRLDFRNNLIKMLDNFSVILEKTAIDRIVELFNLFKDESVQIERKKIILSHFKEIRVLKIGDLNFDAIILAKSPTTFWIVAIKNAALSQNDISEFITECKKYRGLRPQRRIIITFNKINTNAKLKALQEKVITWEIQDLNSLFELYNKPAIFV